MLTLQQQLDLVLKLDRLFDQSEDETSLALSVTSLLAETLAAGFAVLALPEEEHAERIKPLAVIDRGQILEQFAAHELDRLIEEIARRPAGEPLRRQLKTGAGGSLYLIGIPVRLFPGLAGALLLARQKKDFPQYCLAVLQIAGSQLDNALRLLRSNRMVRQEALALRTILRVDRIRDTSASLDDLLARALSEVCQVIPVRAGFIMLYDRSGRRLELRAVSDQSFISLAETHQELYETADKAIASGHMVHQVFPTEASGADDAIRAVLGFPLILNERIIGVLGVVNRLEREDFTHGDRQLMQAIASQMDTAIFEQLQTQRLRDIFGRSVGPHVMERLLQIEDRDLLLGEKIEISSLFSDIRGFTAASEHLDPDQLEPMIDLHLDAMGTVILKNEGTLDKFLGDGVMAFFNAPIRQTDYPMRAVQTALEMQKAQQEVMRAWKNKGFKPLPIGIGVATGEAMVGNFGSPAHAEYSALGSSVNLAARLCSAAEGGQILIDQRTHELVSTRVETQALPPMELKGFSQPVQVWQVTGLKD